jgi:hypothetical protein
MKIPGGKEDAAGAAVTASDALAQADVATGIRPSRMK